MKLVVTSTRVFPTSEIIFLNENSFDRSFLVVVVVIVVAAVFRQRFRLADD